MVKKFLSVMFLAAALVIVGQVKVEAAEVYVGSYSDGTSVYLLTHTISKNYYGSRFVFKCSVRAGGDYLSYVFEGDNNMDDTATTYRNSEGYSGAVYGGNSPVARSIYEYICRH